ncbi:prepilin peptidase [Rhizobium sp. FKY42]|uniref:A24 family peptidase n=1 Tax=Rhizobium sp. FKY42 TaxID=2562310 RepID=UPI001FEF49E1|nr:prepilin peptidase [Rhizobium sp. FKY42]
MSEILFLAISLLLIHAALSDLLAMKIPNWLSLTIVCLFIPAAWLSDLSAAAIGYSLGVAVAVFAVCFLLFVLNVMGGGDAKLLTALALWFGLTPALLVFLVKVAFAGGVLTLAILAIRWKSHLVTDRGVWLPASLTTAKKIPYGIAIAAGALMAMPQAPIFLAAS